MVMGKTPWLGLVVALLTLFCSSNSWPAEPFQAGQKRLQVLIETDGQDYYKVLSAKVKPGACQKPRPQTVRENYHYIELLAENGQTLYSQALPISTTLYYDFDHQLSEKYPSRPKGGSLKLEKVKCMLILPYDSAAKCRLVVSKAKKWKEPILSETMPFRTISRGQKTLKMPEHVELEEKAVLPLVVSP